MELKITIDNLYEKYLEEIQIPNEEYLNKSKEYVRLREKFEREVKLNNKQKELLENICDTIFKMEEIMQKQVFIKGYEIAKDLNST